jgi:hypothetical protein
MHVFELSGLGLAPFKYHIPTTESVRSSGMQFWCSHCGTQIKNRHFIKSSDNQISIVGVDCLRKTGDLGLIDAQKAAIKKEKNDKTRAIREAHWIATQEKQRAANNGFTNDELIEIGRKEIETVLSNHVEEINDHPIMESLNFMGFGYDMQHRAQLVQPFTKGMLSAIKKICCKNFCNCRVNSKAFKEAYVETSKIVEEFQKIIIDKSEELEILREKLKTLYL